MAETYGIMAEFEDVPAIFSAAERCRDEGFQHWDVYAPIPIHGIDVAMGLKESKVPYAMGMGAMTGVGGALLMQWWMMSVDYEIVVAGKPLFSWEAAMPITFELGVLLSAFGALGGMLLLNGLPRWHHPLLKKERFLRVSDDRLVIAIEARDPKFDPDETRRFLESIGGTNVDTVED